ncbi:LysR family transcriptional regulator [Acinetobacter calcoaceticus]|nr:LysR family transcriptional regulator [Acinetobacter calcoaceticus]
MNFMHGLPHGFDLNLLLVFNALYQHKNVAKAAETLFISPSAFSHALNRLRDTLQDPLFVRMNGEMKPTKKSEEIAPSISNCLSTLSQNLFKNSDFDYTTSDYEFVIAATEYTAFSVMPLLVKHLRTIAPNIKIKIISENKQCLIDELMLGKIDFVIGYSELSEGSPNHLEVFQCFADRYVVIAPKNVYQSMNLESFISAQHIRVSSWNEHYGVIDQSLKKMGIRRQICVEVPHVMLAPYMMQSAELIVTLPLKAVDAIKKNHEIDIFELPFSVPEYQVNVYSVEKSKLKACQNWLVDEILSLF